MSVRIVVGDALARLRELPDESVHSCVTSPPYFGLRSYLPADDPAKPLEIGTEASVEDYVAKLVTVFRDVRRVLRADGTLWLVIGDSYARDPGKGQHKPGDSGKQNYIVEGGGGRAANTAIPSGLKPKDLCGIPWRVAFALQADGWWLRAEIVWEKPNCMPESVKGSHYSRHTVTIEEYERLSGLRYRDERAGDDWAGNMPDLSESAVSSSKAPLSEKFQGNRNRTGQGITRGREGEAEAVQPLGVRQAQSGQVCGDQQGQSRCEKAQSEVPQKPTRETGGFRSAPADERRTRATSTEKNRECQVQENRQRESTQAARIRDEKGGDSRDRKSADGRRMGENRGRTRGSLPLLQSGSETHHGSRDTSKQGRAARQGERGSGMRAVQFKETGPAPHRQHLVGCPGCPKCIKHHGYIFHLSAGRPTRSHEYVFLLAKSARYYYDAAAIAEPCVYGDHPRNGNGDEDSKIAPPGQPKQRGLSKLYRDGGPGYGPAADKQRGHGRRHAGFDDRWDKMEREEQRTGMRNKRDVWTIPPANFSEAHFATFPPELARLCILAGCPREGTVLDPFAGACTVGLVAERLQRHSVLIELNPEYARMGEKRIRDESPLFARIETDPPKGSDKLS